MIEIITQKVDMPPLPERKFYKDKRKNRWVVIDKDTDKIRYKSTFENVVIACYNLNKKYYLNLEK